MKIRPIILSGGSGTRLWPISRKRHPKQFAELIGRHSLLIATMRMLNEANMFSAPAIVAQSDHKFFVLDAISQVQKDPATVLLEPCGRNTAAAALVAALAEKEEDVLHLLMPSDHIIGDHAVFFTAVQSATAAAREKYIALFGITPRYPETGYGYIQRGQPSSWQGVDTIKNFREKPDAKTAEELIAKGALWNSGIFLYDPRILIEEVEHYTPEQVSTCRAALDKSKMDFNCYELDGNAYEQLQNISIDYLVMEKTKRGMVAPCAMGWSDVGSWQALWQIEEKDKAENVVHGPVATLDVSHSYIRSDGLTVGVIGLEDIVVVATKDAVLVTPRSRSQDVKQLVALMEMQKRNVAVEHCRVMRPWGSYEGVASGDRFQVKHIIVKPGQSLSLQMHNHRAEHWVVVAGTALVECDDLRKNVFENESIFIPKGSKHRLSNPGKVMLHLVEVQSGEYLGEDDIVRFSDIYGRVA